MTGRLRDRVAIITGATGAIGGAITARFAAEGARLVLTGARQAATGFPAAARYVGGDVTDEPFVERLVAETLATLGRIDILVNAHGIDFHSELDTTDLGAARRVIDVNLLGPLLTMKHVLPAMVRAGRGSIVNVASRLGQVAIPGQTVYAASKGGLIMLTRGAAIDYGRRGIRANVVSPGMTETEMIDAWLRQQPDPAAFREELERTIPLGRFAGTSEIADAVLFLASDESSHVTGAVLPVDGGYTAA